MDVRRGSFIRWSFSSPQLMHHPPTTYARSVVILSQCRRKRTNVNVLATHSPRSIPSLPWSTHLHFSLCPALLSATWVAGECAAVARRFGNSVKSNYPCVHCHGNQLESSPELLSLIQGSSKRRRRRGVYAETNRSEEL